MKKKGTRRYTTFHNSPFFYVKKKKKKITLVALFLTLPGSLSLSCSSLSFFFYTSSLYGADVSERVCPLPAECRLNFLDSNVTNTMSLLLGCPSFLFFVLLIIPPPPSRSARQGNQANVRVSKTSLSISVRSSGAIHTRIREETKTLPCTIQTENPLTALYLDTNDMTPGRTTSIHALFQLGDEEEKKWRHFYASSP